jgi:RNA polymerase sigma-70 factor (ECF subfamily)
MTLTRNRSLDRTRAQTNRRTAPLDGLRENSLTDGDKTTQATENHDLVAHARRIMQGLPEKQRLVMHLRDVEEHSYEEIAEVLSISIDQVKVNLHRARKTVREHMLKLSATGSPEAIR